MSLIDITPEALQWVEQEIATRSQSPTYGRIESGVIWTDDAGPDGPPVGGSDPHAIAKNFGNGLPITRDHDPGLPQGTMLTAKTFTAPSGRTFVAAIMGLYTEDNLITYTSLGVNPTPLAESPGELPLPPSNTRAEIICDLRDIDESWLRDLLNDCPLKVDFKEGSNIQQTPSSSFSILDSRTSF